LSSLKKKTGMGEISHVAGDRQKEVFASKQRGELKAKTDSGMENLRGNEEGTLV